MLRLNHVTKVYDARSVALKDVTFDVPQGQFCVLLGHSGAGKSTILRVVNGLVKPTSGSVTVEGQEISPKTLNQVRQKVSMIHQEFNLATRSSVAANVLSGALANVSTLRALLGWFPASMRRKCCDLVERVGLAEHHLLRRVSELSGGQQQRVGIARALMTDPKIILADEPIASLDPSISREIMSLLYDAAKRSGCTILCSLHQPDIARQFADRIIGVEGGRIVFDLSSNEVDDEVLSLIYRNYDDPAGENTIEAASVEKIVEVSVKSKT